MGRFGTAFEPKIENRLNYTTEYVFREYPKYVTRADGSQIIGDDGHAVTARSKEEEESILAADAGSDSDRDSLMEQARALGLNPHHKTGEEKLRQLIAEARG